MAFHVSALVYQNWRFLGYRLPTNTQNPALIPIDGTFPVYDYAHDRPRYIQPILARIHLREILQLLSYYATSIVWIRLDLKLFLR